VKNIGKSLDKFLQYGLCSIHGILTFELNTDSRGMVGGLKKIYVFVDHSDRRHGERCITVNNVASDNSGIDLGLRCLESQMISIHMLDTVLEKKTHR
jgi:hypothetical protein